MWNKYINNIRLIMDIELSKNQIFACVVVVIIFVVFIWVAFPFVKRLFSKTEKYSHVTGAASRPRSFKPSTRRLKQTARPPFVDPVVGMIIDGPGHEKSMGEVYWPEHGSIPSNYYFLDDGADGEMSIQHNLCSKSCCADQWPTPFKQKYDPYVCTNKGKFRKSRYFCNNTFQDSGCLCLSDKQAKFIYNRGGNGREWF